MTRSVLLRVSIIFLSFLVFPVAFGQTVPAPDGWTASQQGANWVYKASKLAAPAVVTVTVEPVQSIDGKDLSAWFESRMKADAASRGKLEKIHKINAPQGMQLENRDYRDSANQLWLLSYIGIQVAPQKGLFCAVAATPPESTGAYVRAGGSICGSFAKKLKQTTTAAK